MAHHLRDGGQWRLPRVICTLVLSTTHTFPTCHRSTGEAAHSEPMVVASANVTQQVGERGPLVWQWVVKAQLGSGVDRTLLLERTSPRTPG